VANTDLGINITSRFDGRGFKNAEDSARVLERALRRQEEQAQRLGRIEEQAYSEQARRAAAAAGAEEDAARRRSAALEDVGRVSVAAGLVVAAGLGLSARAAIDWETAFTGVRKTVGGSEAELAAVEEQFRALARTLPASHQELAAVGEAAGQLGVQRSQLVSFTRTAVDLGNTTNLSAEEAATALAQLANVYGISGDRADEMGDNTARAGASLVALGNDGASTEADIVSMGLRIAGAGRQIGLTQAQVLGFASGLSSVGIEAEAGGSAISRVFVDIGTAVDTGGAKLDTFAQVAGVSTEQFRQQFEDDAAGAVIAFVEGLGRMQESGQSTFQVLDELGLSEIRVRDALLRTSQASDLLRSSVDLGSQAWAENSALIEEAAQRYQTAEARIQVARNQINDAAIDIGTVMLPALAGVAERAGFLAQVFGDLPGPVQQMVVAVGSAAAAVGILGGAAALAIPAVDRLKLSLLDLGRVRAAAAISGVASLLTGPWGLAVAGAVALTALLAERQFEAARRVEELRETLDQQTGAVTDNTRAKLLAQLQEEGLLQKLEQVNLTWQDGVEAAAGNAEAMRRVREATELATTSDEDLVAAKQALTDGVGASTFAFDALTAAERESTVVADEDAKVKNEVRSALEALNGTVSTAREEQERSAEATKGSAEASGEAASAADELAGSMDGANVAIGEAASSTEGFVLGMDGTMISAEDAAAAVEELIRTFDDMASSQLDAREASRQHQDAIAEFEEQLRRAIEENGEAARTLDIATDAGRRNQAALDAIAASANRQTESMLENGAAHEDVVAHVDNARDAFSRAAQAAGLGAEEADRLAAELIAVPENTNAVVTVSGVETAIDRARAVQRALLAIDDRTVFVTINERQGTVVRRAGAGGAIVERARGGFTPAGMVLVGEEGPELLDLRDPGRVYSASDTRALQEAWGGAGRLGSMPAARQVTGSPGVVTGEVTLSSQSIAALADELRRQPLSAVAYLDGRSVADVVSEHQARSVRGGVR
jgi:TP901 family phage tail tape measure protein